MANKEFPYVYPYSCEETKRLCELDQWRESRKENIACKDVVEDAIRCDFDGMRLKADCAGSVISEFGYHRVA